MKRIATNTVGAYVAVLALTGPVAAQQPQNYCDTLKMLVDSAKDGFASVQDLKMPGAESCSVDTATRSFGCMWAFEQASAATASYDKAVKTATSCFPSVAPKQSRSTRGTLHTEYDFGQALIDISRSKPGNREGDWYSIDVVAP